MAVGGIKPGVWTAGMERRVREIAERDRGRRPGHDPTVRVRHVDPATLHSDRHEEGVPVVSDDLKAALGRASDQR